MTSILQRNANDEAEYSDEEMEEEGGGGGNPDKSDTMRRRIRSRGVVHSVHSAEAVEAVGAAGMGGIGPPCSRNV